MIFFKKQKLLLIMIFFAQSSSLFADDNGFDDKKIKLYTFYTPSHEILLKDWFLPSVNRFNEYEVIVRKCEQECSTAEFMSPGWVKTMLHKEELILDAIKENWGAVFIYSDVDIQFFSTTRDEILQALGDKDLVFQRDDPYGTACTGFFACRANENTLELWQAVVQYMLENQGKYSDQRSLNYLLKQDCFAAIKWNLLPITFFGAGTLTGKHWAPDTVLKAPAEVKMHHANWTSGIENKIAQLTHVKSLVLAKKASDLTLKATKKKSKRNSARR